MNRSKSRLEVQTGRPNSCGLCLDASVIKGALLIALGFVIGISIQTLWWRSLWQDRGVLGWKATNIGRRASIDKVKTISKDDRNYVQAHFREKCCTGSHISDGHWDGETGKWVRSNSVSEGEDDFCHDKRQFQHGEESRCLTLRPERKEDVKHILSCMTMHRRIVFVGDSVQRGLFWSFVDMIKEASGAVESNLTITIQKNYDQKKFTNFQDQDMIVSDAKSGKEVFSVRFIYASNAIDWPGRCEMIGKWFFQCLKSMSEILSLVVEQERYRETSQQNIKTRNSEKNQ